MKDSAVSVTVLFSISDSFSTHFWTQFNFIHHWALWQNVCTPFSCFKHSKSRIRGDRLKWWMNEVDPVFFLHTHKRREGDEGHLPSAAFVTRPERDKNPAADGRRERKKRSALLLLSFFLSCSVWPAFVRRSGVIYHVHDAWSSPCQRNPTKPCCRWSLCGVCVCVCVCA